MGQHAPAVLDIMVILFSWRDIVFMYLQILKTIIAVLYACFALLLCALIMTIVNDKVPDMETYPPLPDMFLDNFPFIDWAMVASECISMVLMAVFITICILHKHR